MTTYYEVKDQCYAVEKLIDKRHTDEAQRLLDEAALALIKNSLSMSLSQAKNCKDHITKLLDEIQKLNKKAAKGVK